MTSQKISELSSFFTGSVGTQAAGRAKAGDTSFSNLMKNSTGKADTASTSDKSETTQSAKSARGAERTASPSKLDRSRESKPEQMDDTDLEAADQAKEAADQIADEIKETLGITDEQLASAMETLGLTTMDLLDPESLQQVFTELTGVTDAISLLTDENLYSQLGQVMDTAKDALEELKQDLDLDDEQLKSLISDLRQQAHNPVAETAENLQSTELSAESDEEESPVRVTLEDDRKNPGLQTEGRDAAETVPVEREEKAPRQENAGEQNPQGQFSGNDFSRDLMNELTEAVRESDATGYTSFADAEEITKQVIDQIKVKISEESQSMEMQLNPESLGRLNLTVESRNGIITAQITAQEEAVKNAIEGQIEQLRQTLEEQGVKVDAVEVSVAAHEFEQNLQQGGDQTRQEEENERAASIGGRRRTSVNLLGEDEESEEDLDEADRLNRDMMIRNGNMVDYTA